MVALPVELVPMKVPPEPVAPVVLVCGSPPVTVAVALVPPVPVPLVPVPLVPVVEACELGFEVVVALLLGEVVAAVVPVVIAVPVVELSVELA